MHPWLWSEEDEELEERTRQFREKWESGGDNLTSTRESAPPVCDPTKHKAVNISLYRIKLVCTICNIDLPEEYICV